MHLAYMAIQIIVYFCATCVHIKEDRAGYAVFAALLTVASVYFFVHLIP